MWNRRELSRLLLLRGDKACDVYTEAFDFRRPYCSKCGEDYEAHLCKAAAEEIGVMDARENKRRELADRWVNQAESLRHYVGEQGYRSALYHCAEELAKL